MKIEEQALAEGKGTGEDIKEEIKKEVKEELEENKAIDPEEKYQRLLNLALNKSEGHFRQFIVDTIQAISGKGDEVEVKDEKYRVWKETKEEDFGNILFNVVMNLGLVYNKLCSVKETATIQEAFAVDDPKTPPEGSCPLATPQTSPTSDSSKDSADDLTRLSSDEGINPLYEDQINEPVDIVEI